jgi:predicted membrane GTPase involved in stress response
MEPLFETIIEHIPAPVDNSDEPLQFQVSLLDYNDFVGRIGIGRVFRGTIKVGDSVTFQNLMAQNKTSVSQNYLVSSVSIVLKSKKQKLVI